MSWQEDLQQLDAALAGGQISADDYRRRRDEVLAKASGGSVPAEAPQPPAAAPVPSAQQPQQSQYAQSGQPAHGQAAGQNSFPPPFKWQSTAPSTNVPAATAAEATQTIRPVAPPDSDSTQVVSGTQATVAASADRTQVVRGAPRQQGPNSGGFPAQYAPQPGGQSPWPQHPQQQQPDTSAPWASSEFPPLGGAGNWALKQGPEVFGDGSGSVGKRIAVIAAVIVVLAGLGVGAYFLFFSKSDTNTQATHQVTQPTATHAPPPRPKDPLAIAKLPGTGQDQSGISSFSDVVNNGLLTNDENNAYLTAGATGARLATSTLPNGVHLWVMTARVSSAATAGTAASTLAQLQVKYGLSTYTGTTPKNVLIDEKVGANGATLIRGHYAHGNIMIRVQVNGTDQSTVGKTFDEILAAQLSALPANAS